MVVMVLVLPHLELRYTMMKLKIPNQDSWIIKEFEPDMEKGPWIAGGAVRQWFLGESFGSHDVDIFVKNKKQLDHLKECFGVLDKIETKNAITFKINGVSIQVITKIMFGSAQEVIDSFDLTCCQLVTDGYGVIVGDTTINDITTKTLNSTDMLDSFALARITKYVSYGYTPSNELIKKLRNMDLTTDFKNSDDYDTLPSI